MFKKFSLVVLAVSAILLSGCTPAEDKSDTDIIYEVKGALEFTALEVTEDVTILTTDVEGVTLTWTSSEPTYLGIDGVVTRPTWQTGDKSVSLTVEIKLNEAIASKVFNFTITAFEKPENIELNTDYTDDLAIDFTYDSTEFIANGIGEVSLVSCVDGDTAIFTEGSGTFSVRFLGINTPESTYKFEPWGKPASDFTCDKLTTATTIVLEYDASTTRTDGNERYLAWVWYDGRLLNLELVEEAYTGSKGVSNLKYESIFYSAEFKTQDSDKRIWGEQDPGFDYSLDGIQVTIEELVTNQEDYVGLKVVIQGIVSRSLNGHPYIQSGDYGIYLYKGFEFTTKLAVGNEVLISGLTLTYFPDVETGSVQLTSFFKKNIEVLSTDNVVAPLDITIDELSRDSIGSLVRLTGLTVTSIFENTADDAFTVTAEDSEGNVITLRRDDGSNDNLTGDLFTVGTTFDVVAPLGRYSSMYQMILITIDDVTFTD